MQSNKIKATILCVLVSLMIASPVLAQGDDAPTDGAEEQPTEQPGEAPADAPEEAAVDEQPAEEPPAEDRAAGEPPAEEPVAAEPPTEEVDPAPAAAEPPVEEEPVLDDPYLPGVGIEDDDDDHEYEDDLDEVEDEEELPDLDPYAKGDMELGIGLGGWGSGDYFTLMVGANFAYYVVARLAPGIQIDYQTTFGDVEFPQSLTTLPFLKFVLIRSRKFAPYVIMAGGREFQWAGTDDPAKGFKAVSAWIFGGGVGAHIGLGEHFAIKIQVLGLHYWFDEKVLLVGDSKATDKKLFIPVISLGMSIMF